MNQVAPAPGSLYVVDDHALNEHLTLGAVDKVAAELDRHRLLNLLVFRNRIDLVLGQLAQGQAVFERQHGKPHNSSDLWMQLGAAQPKSTVPREATTLIRSNAQIRRPEAHAG